MIGAGAAGANAVRVAVGMGADVTVFDVNTAALAHLEEMYRRTGEDLLLGTADVSPSTLPSADLVIGATLTPGKLAPRLITRAMLRRMRRGSVLVDISIDQGGIAETSRPTSHSHPIYVEEGVVHYCVPNMPAAVARTATLALTQVTIPYVVKLADRGWKAALADDAGLRDGLAGLRGPGHACGPCSGRRQAVCALRAGSCAADCCLVCLHQFTGLTGFLRIDRITETSDSVSSPRRRRTGGDPEVLSSLGSRFRGNDNQG